MSAVEAGRDYFAAPPTIRVPFAGEDGKPVEAEVEYAYCLVDYQCLFGETKVSAPTQRAERLTRRAGLSPPRPRGRSRRC